MKTVGFLLLCIIMLGVQLAMCSACNVLMQNIPAVYHMVNFGYARNCTLSVLLPATIALAHLKIGGMWTHHNINYKCGMIADRLEFGGSSSLVTSRLDEPPISKTKTADIYGHSEKQVREQAIFCNVKTVRLLSTGRYENYAAVVLRKADEVDLGIAAIICPV